MTRLEDVDQLYELGLIGKSQWILDRWQWCIDHRNRVTGTDLALILPELHRVCLLWIEDHKSKRDAGEVEYTIDLDMMLLCELFDRSIALPLREAFLEARPEAIVKYLTKVDRPTKPEP